MSDPFKFRPTPQGTTDAVIHYSAEINQNLINTEEKKKGAKTSTRNHPGNGTKADTVALRVELEKFHRLGKDAEKLLTKLRNDKEGLLFILANLKIKEGQLSPDVSEGVRRGFQSRVAAAESEIARINGDLPEHSLSEDQKEMENIIKRWDEGVGTWEKEIEQANAAEKLLRKRPDDGKAMGMANRARAEKLATEAELANIADEAKKTLERNQPPKPVDQEGVHYTHEQAVADRKDWEERHKKAQADAVLEAVPADESLPAPEGVAILNETSQAEETMENPNITTAKNDPSLLNKVPAEATANNWQDEAVKNFESTRNPVPAFELLPSSNDAQIAVPENNDASIPTLTEVVGPPREGQEGAFEKFEFSTNAKLNLTPDQESLIKQLEKNIDAAQKPLEERVVAANAEGPVRRVVLWWKELPLPKKLLVSGGLIVGGYTAGLAAAPFVFGAGLAVRLLGAAALFDTVNEKLKDDAMLKSGVPLTNAEEARSAWLAGALTFTVAAFLPAALHEQVITPAMEKVVGPALDKLHEFFPDKPTVEAMGFSDSAIIADLKLGQANLAALDAAQASNTSIVAETGDSRWSMAERALASGPYADQFNAIESAEKRTHIIDAIKDKLTVGMSAEQANTLTAGDKIDFNQIFKDKDFMNGAFGNTESLTPAQIENIQNYDPSPVPEETAPLEPAQLEPAPSNATMPGEFQPQKEIMLAELTSYANKILTTDIDKLFGSSKLFGFGHVSGVDSINWKDSGVGFSNKTIGEILNAHPSAFPESGNRTFGIENPEAVKKMQDYITKDVSVVSGISPIPTETVAQFIERAVIKTTTLSK